MASEKLLLVGVSVLCLGLLLHIIGMATPEWSVGDVIVTVNTTGIPATATAAEAPTTVSTTSVTATTPAAFSE